MSRIPYTYLIGWSSLDTWYYGRRTAKGCHPDELWIKYFTSSKLVEQFRARYGDPDIIQVRRTFNSPNQCAAWECKVLERIDAQHNPRFLNQRNGDLYWDTTGLPISKNVMEKRIRSARGKAAAKDAKTGESLGRVPLSDPRWHTGDIVGSTKGKHYGKYSKERVYKNKQSQLSLVENQNHYWQTEEHKISTSKRTKESILNGKHPFGNILTCPHCSKQGQAASMRRWHFDKCHLLMCEAFIASS